MEWHTKKMGNLLFSSYMRSIRAIIFVKYPSLFSLRLGARRQLCSNDNEQREKVNYLILRSSNTLVYSSILTHRALHQCFSLSHNPWYLRNIPPAVPSPSPIVLQFRGPQGTHNQKAKAKMHNSHVRKVIKQTFHPQLSKILLTPGYALT